MHHDEFIGHVQQRAKLAKVAEMLPDDIRDLITAGSTGHA